MQLTHRTRTHVHNYAYLRLLSVLYNNLFCAVHKTISALPSSEIWRYVFWYIGMDVPEERAPVDAEDGGSIDLWSLMPSSLVSQNTTITTEQNIWHSASFRYPRIYVKLKRHDLPYSYADFDLKHYVLVCTEMFRERHLFRNTFGLFSPLKETLTFILFWFPYRSNIELNIWLNTTYFLF
jgi:hypothetical protein